MSNMRIIADNIIDTATVTSSPAAATNAPVTNLQNGLRAYVSRMTTVASPWTILNTWAADQSISGVCLYKHNFTAGAIVRISLYSDTAATTQIYDSGSISLGYVNPWGIGLWGVFEWGGMLFEDWPASYFTHWIPSTYINARALKVVITDTGNPEGYLEMGRIYAGEYFSPAINISYGADMVWEEQSRQFRTDGNSLRTEGYEPYRFFNISIDNLSEIERAVLTGYFRKVGMRKDFLFSGAPEQGGDIERDWTAAVKLTAMPSIKASSYDVYSTNMQMEEV